MKVLVASSETQGEVEGDFAWTLDGELVHLPIFECASGEDCGCDSSFSGAASHRATTTAEVAERELDWCAVVQAVAQSLVDGGWFESPRAPDALSCAGELVAPLLEVAGREPAGTVVRRHRDLVFVREP